MTAEADVAENRHDDVQNFSLLAAYQVMIRVGWIFKTESIIMPAVLDSVSGSGWLRGCLPLLNRLGQSLPPIWCASWIGRNPYKKQLLFSCSASMGIIFLLLAMVWLLFPTDDSNWLAMAFLILYGLFWFCVGIHNLVVSLLHGKLIPIGARGRLMLVATVIGAILAILSAYLILGYWIEIGSRGFFWMFVVAGVSFSLAAILALALQEPPDGPQDALSSEPTLAGFRESWRILRRDSNFRRLAWISGGYGTSITLFPHYQAYIRESLNIGTEAFLPWLIAQNLGAAVFSIPMGQTADRSGNRRVIQGTMAGLCLAPVLTLIWIRYLPHYPMVGFCMVFFLLGLTPITMRIFANYTLEIVPREQQPTYLSTLGVCMALPVIIFSILIGAALDIAGFEPVFLLVIAILAGSWILTFGLDEPRSGPDNSTTNPNGRTLT